MAIDAEDIITEKKSTLGVRQNGKFKSTETVQIDILFFNILRNYYFFQVQTHNRENTDKL